MAFGTEEAKKKAEWMKVYNDVLEKTGRDDLARRAANAETAEPTRSRAGGGGGGFSSPAPTMSNLDRLRAAAQTDPSARAALMRLQAEQSRAMSGAGDLRESGQFGAAARAEIRAERRAGQRADRAAALESATDMFGGSNMGEAFENYRRQMQGSGEKAVSEADFKNWAADQVKTEKERELEAERGVRPGGKKDEPANPLNDIVSKLDDIIQEITDRLPQNSLAA